MSDSKEPNKYNCSKKRHRNPSEWKREKSKRLRVAGKQYMNSKGHVVEARMMGEDCKCRRKCYVNITEENRRLLFHGYYSLKSHDEQNAYLFGLIRRQGIARKRSKGSDRRSCTYKYFLRLKGREIQVCRLAFANIHGISPHKIRILCQKLDRNVMFPGDGRGKHDNRPKRISSSVVNKIKEHIYSIIKSDKVHNFLKETKNTGADLNLTKMWRDYLEKHDPNFKGCRNFTDKPVHTQYEPLNFLSAQEKIYNNIELSPVPLNSNHGMNNNLYPVEQPFEQSKSAAFAQNLHNNNRLLVYDQENNGLSKAMASSACSSFQDVDTFKDLNSIVNNQCSDDNSLFLRTGREDEAEKEEQTSASKRPLVKQWLYSKVFHDEFSFQDYISLKRRLMDKLKTAPELITKGQQKSERKQRLPKKISRDRAKNTRKGVIRSPTELNNVCNVQQNHAVSQSNSYLMPIFMQSVPTSLSLVGQNLVPVDEVATTHISLNFPLPLNQGPENMHPNVPEFAPIQHSGHYDIPSAPTSDEIGNYVSHTAAVILPSVPEIGISSASCEYFNSSNNFYQ